MTFDYYQYWKDSLGKNLSRDNIFFKVLDNFNEQPINVLEIGGARDISLNCRYGDGWSSLFWAEYIDRYGGSLKICDISDVSLYNASLLLKSFKDKINIEYLNIDGIDILKENNNYDLIYLDGSDCPIEMYEQFKLCDLKISYIFCDDFNQKGTILSNQNKNHILYRLNNNHQMALFHHTINNFKRIDIL